MTPQAALWVTLGQLKGFEPPSEWPLTTRLDSEELGLDSLEILDLLLGLQERLQCFPRQAELEGAETLGELLEVFDRKLKGNQENAL